MRISPGVRSFAIALMLVVVPHAGDARATALDTLVVRVVDEDTQRPIANADVLDQGSGVHRLTDARGEARFIVGMSGTVRIRVRQLGFRPVERVVEWTAGGVRQPVVIALQRARILSSVNAQESNACRGTADSLPNPLSLQALEQLRFGAEQYQRFWDAYPFSVSLERRTAFNHDSVPADVVVRHEQLRQREWGDPYRPGQVLTGEGYATRAIPLTIGALADPVFWEHHCFVVRNVATVDGRRVLPLEFMPALSLESADYGGTAWVDSTTSELRRVDFQLRGLQWPATVRRMEGYMTFTHPSPFIARPDSIVSFWWLKEPDPEQGWGTPTSMEVLRVAGIQYLKGEPPNSLPSAIPEPARR